MLLPGLGWLLVFFAAPLAIMFVVSFGQRDHTAASTSWASLEGPLRRALDPGYLPAVPNTIKYAAVTTVLSLILATRWPTSSPATAAAARCSCWCW